MSPVRAPLAPREREAVTGATGQGGLMGGERGPSPLGTAPGRRAGEPTRATPFGN